MAINQNHTVEEFDGVRCAVVEKNANETRVNFIKNLLEHNGFTVLVVKSPPPKGATPEQIEAIPVSYMVGVTDVRFNATNAVFGRLLNAPNGDVVTLAYWQQKENESDSSIPYFEKFSTNY